MWFLCLIISASCVFLTAAITVAANKTKRAKKQRISLFHTLFAGVFAAAMFAFLPIHLGTVEPTLAGGWRAFLLSVFNAMQVFAIGCDFELIGDAMVHCPETMLELYQIWAATLFVLAPIFTFGFVLSLFKNLTAYLKYLGTFRKDKYVFSELNEKSLTLAKDIKAKNKNAAIVFTDVFEESEEITYERVESAKQLGAICFKKDILVVNFKIGAGKKPIYFFAIGSDETENIDHGLKLIENYRNREHTHIYVFSTKIESELLLADIDKGVVKVRRINEVRSLVNRVLYEQGHVLFDSARQTPDGEKKISAIVVGMGALGTEMVKALTWFGQMDGYRLEIHGFDQDPLSEERFIAIAPELMSPKYNGVSIAGEPYYQITMHPGLDVTTISFANAISQITDATYVMVALGNDETNIQTAVNLRMYFERMQIHPVIQALVQNSQQMKALEGIRNFRGQAYDIGFIGDIESSYTEAVIMDSELEEDALKRHLKWGEEEAFWTYEYNYRSSTASAIHMKARIHCKIPGADKDEGELTQEERDNIEVLEHCRWNAYMRSEGYVFSGSKEASSRNDLAKMHHNLVDFSQLSEEDKRKDSRVGSK